MEPSDLSRLLSGLPVRWNHSTFGPAAIHIRGYGPWTQLNIYVQEQDLPTFAHCISALMQALPVWTAMSRWCRSERGSWSAGYLSVKRAMLPSGGMFLTKERFNPDHYIQSSNPRQALAYKRGMLAFLDQVPEAPVATTVGEPAA